MDRFSQVRPLVFKGDELTFPSNPRLSPVQVLRDFVVCKSSVSPNLKPLDFLSECVFSVRDRQRLPAQFEWISRIRYVLQHLAVPVCPDLPFDPTSEARLRKTIKFYQAIRRLDEADPVVCLENIVKLGNLHWLQREHRQARELYEEATSLLEELKQLEPDLSDSARLQEVKFAVFNNLACCSLVGSSDRKLAKLLEIAAYEGNSTAQYNLLCGIPKEINMPYANSVLRRMQEKLPDSLPLFEQVCQRFVNAGAGPMCCQFLEEFITHAVKELPDRMRAQLDLERVYLRTYSKPRPDTILKTSYWSYFRNNKHSSLFLYFLELLLELAFLDRRFDCVVKIILDLASDRSVQENSHALKKLYAMLLELYYLMGDTEQLAEVEQILLTLDGSGCSSETISQVRNRSRFQVTLGLTSAILAEGNVTPEQFIHSLEERTLGRATLAYAGAVADCCCLHYDTDYFLERPDLLAKAIELFEVEQFTTSLQYLDLCMYYAYVLFYQTDKEKGSQYLEKMMRGESAAEKYRNVPVLIRLSRQLQERGSEPEGSIVLYQAVLETYLLAPEHYKHAANIAVCVMELLLRTKKFHECRYFIQQYIQSSSPVLSKAPQPVLSKLTALVRKCNYHFGELEDFE